MPWKRYSGHTLERLPHGAGCYAIFSSPTLLYIGQSQRVRARLLNGHKLAHARGGRVVTPWGRREHVEVRVRRSRRYGEELMREARLIRRLKPLRNTQYIPPRRGLQPRDSNPLHKHELGGF